MTEKRRRKTPKQDAMDHILLDRDKSFLKEKFIDRFKDELEPDGEGGEAENIGDDGDNEDDEDDKDDRDDEDGDDSSLVLGLSEHQEMEKPEAVTSSKERFAESDYHRLALQKLEACPVAMETLGAPPLKVHNIHLTDRNNRVDRRTAQGAGVWVPGLTIDLEFQIKIPVTGSETGGYLYAASVQDPDTNRWSLQQAVLKLREGRTIDLLSPPPPAPGTPEELDTGGWH
ncbi:Cytochrome c oxidase assembly factor 1 [Liparis tanakae]|uniref:Cytochrome c oxidase assembly factor 1 n=1 Tax=Liparis tanakae TaxID=230148 RepID=A0A4Z2EYP6_9TELE|nr:Cytochrome c oxidase assembly factor 1 [Liparis tanakae]